MTSWNVAKFEIAKLLKWLDRIPIFKLIIEVWEAKAAAGSVKYRLNWDSSNFKPVSFRPFEIERLENNSPAQVDCWIEQGWLGSCFEQPLGTKLPRWVPSSRWPPDWHPSTYCSSVAPCTQPGHRRRPVGSSASSNSTMLCFW